MSNPNLNSIRRQLPGTVGPSPWYWKSFPAFHSASEQRFVWTHQGSEGPVGYVISLSLQGAPEKPRLALNTYCRPFLASAQCLAVWCPEVRTIRVTGFNPDQLEPFDLSEIAGWFKQSVDRMYAKTSPIAEFELPLTLSPGIHKIEVPPELSCVDEIILPTSYQAMSDDDPAFALFVLYLRAGLVEVLPQKWFTAAQYEVGKQWISRASRDKDSGRIFGECFGAGIFLLEEDGCRLAEWVDRKP